MSEGQRRVLVVGVAAWDIVNEVDVYPGEDAEVRARGQRVARGGNAANTVSVLSQMGHACAWAGTLGGDTQGDLILADLERQQVDTGACVRLGRAGSPTSYVTLSRATGSRTIVHHRDLRELSAADFCQIPLNGYDWVHFEGRNPPETAAMLRDCRKRLSGVGVSLEIEKPRPGIETLFAGPDVLIFSRSYAQSRGYTDPPKFLADQWGCTDARLLVLPWGDGGAYGQPRGGDVCFVPAHAPPRIRDTLAAGDVFNAGLIDGLLIGLEPEELLARANMLAGHKCGMRGMDGVVESARAAGLL
jgi:ketohexokinase